MQLKRTLKHSLTVFSLATLLLVSVEILLAQTANVTVETMLRDMIDLRKLAVRPLESEFCGQYSSYDRASRIENGQKVNWFANADAGHFIRDMDVDGRSERVMADLEGPGAIVRIWSANPTGVLRIYLDGSEEPALEKEFSSLFGGRLGYPFVEPFSGMRSSGANLYFPIPYAKSALVTSEGSKGMYYQVNYKKFPAGTRVETFSLAAAQKTKPVGDVVSARLTDPYSKWTVPSGGRVQQIYWKLGPGEAKHLNLSGPAEIVALQLRPVASDINRALRDTVISITWDDQDAPSVWSPLGDFFGTGPGVNPYRGLPAGMLETGMMYSHWVMPFAKKARIQITNEGGKPITIFGKAVVRPVTWNDSLMYFHAKWCTEHPIKTRPHIDWCVLSAKGPGRFVGTSLSLANPDKAWWGEGDEKFYVDGEEFPSTFGTGTEDYFGYAWCNPGLFFHAYHNQPRADGPRNYGHVSNNRFHIIDNIPFQKSFHFDLEVWHWAEKIEVEYSAISYWYSNAVNEDFYVPVPVERRQIVYLPVLKIYRETGALEGEKLEVVKSTGGRVSTQDLLGHGDGWSGGSHLWWTGASLGDTLELAIPVKSSGRYKVVGAFTKAKDYGRVRLKLAGQVLGDELDLYHDSVAQSGRVVLGEVNLANGDNILKIEIAGTNEASIGDRHMFGLDYVKLETVETSK